MTKAMDNHELADAVSALAVHWSTEGNPFQVPVPKKCSKCRTLQSVFVAPDGICAMCWMVSLQDTLDFLFEGLPEMLERLRRRRSIATPKMADVLFALTTDKDGQDSLIEAARLPSVEGLNLARARSEIVFLNLSAVYVALFGCIGRNEKLHSMYTQYLAQVKEHVRQLGTVQGEAELLLASEHRLNEYVRIYALWHEAHKKGRGHEQSFAIGEAFFGFCDTAYFNPISLSIVQHHFFTVIQTTLKALEECKLVI